jgi:hypothetical protein
MQLITRNLNMLLVLKSERLMMNYHQFFEKKCKKAKKKYSTHIFMKIGSNSGKFITEIIIGKNFINSESLMDWDAVAECAK